MLIFGTNIVFDFYINHILVLFNDLLYNLPQLLYGFRQVINNNRGKRINYFFSFPLGKHLYCKYRQYLIHYGGFQLYDGTKVIHIQ